MSEEQEASGVPAEESGETKAVVTVDMFNEAIDKLSMKLVSDQRAMAGRLNKQIEEMRTASAVELEDDVVAEDGKSDVPAWQKAERTKLKRERESLRKERELLQLREIRTALASELRRGGVEDDNLVSIASEGIMAKNRGKLDVTVNDFGSVVHTHNDGVEVRPLSDFVADFLKAEGSSLLPSKRNPRMSDGASSEPVARKKITALQANKLSADELKSGAYEIEG